VHIDSDQVKQSEASLVEFHKNSVLVDRKGNTILSQIGPDLSPDPEGDRVGSRADSPWRRLPQRAPFLLPQDKDIVMKFNESANEDLKLHHELLPEPFLGNPEAPVVLLNKNPGYSSPKDLTDHTPPASNTGAWSNLLHKRTAFPFYLLDPDQSRALGYKWWNNKLKSLIENCGRRLVARSVLCVEYFPYHSRRFGHGELALPSQQYNFDLVRSAISRHAVIVVMRGKRQWFKAIPELQSYSRIYYLRNPQNPTISPKNCPEGYASVVRAIGRMAP
jgi:hypothetical protein